MQDPQREQEKLEELAEINRLESEKLAEIARLEAEEDQKPYDQGIVKVLQWGMETETQLKRIPSEDNWCGSKIKCYYGGVIPMHATPFEAATNFVMTSFDNVKVSENPNTPIITTLKTENFFIMLVDLKKEDEIKSYYYFYNGIESLKNFGKKKLSLTEFTIDQVGEFRKPWQNICKEELEATDLEFKDTFKQFFNKVKLQQNNEQHTHEDHCHCGQDHAAAESTGNN